jgi:hypothetical protein
LFDLLGRLDMEEMSILCAMRIAWQVFGQEKLKRNNAYLGYYPWEGLYLNRLRLRLR